MRRSAFLLVLLFAALPAWATDHYWINNGGNWSDTSHWSPAPVPAATDNVFFNASSFSVGSQTVVLDSGALARVLTMDWTGATNAPTLQIGAINTAPLQIEGGTLIFAAGMYVTGGPSTQISMDLPSGSGTITTNGV